MNKNQIRLELSDAMQQWDEAWAEVRAKRSDSKRKKSNVQALPQGGAKKGNDTPERSQILAVGAFQTWLTIEGVTAGIADRKQWMLDNLKELRGKNLACWCKPGTACHADVLLRLANDSSSATKSA
jgi:uncharacterized protein (DUF2235 family)